MSRTNQCLKMRTSIFVYLYPKKHNQTEERHRDRPRWRPKLMCIFKNHVAVLITSFSIGLCCLYKVVTCYSGDPDVSVVSCSCSDQKYSTSDTDYDSTVKDVMTTVVDETPEFNYDLYAVDPRQDFVVYGHGACNTRLYEVACGTCMYIAMKQLEYFCPMSVGAQLQLGDCRIRYENYSFTEWSKCTLLILYKYFFG